jgi:putative transposase
MDRKLLRDDQWARIEPLLPGKAGDRGVTAKDNRLFIEAVLWIAGVSHLIYSELNVTICERLTNRRSCSSSR